MRVGGVVGWDDQLVVERQVVKLGGHRMSTHLILGWFALLKLAACYHNRLCIACPDVFSLFSSNTITL